MSDDEPAMGERHGARSGGALAAPAPDPQPEPAEPARSRGPGAAGAAHPSPQPDAVSSRAAALPGARKAAVFILSLEEDEATLLLRNLSDSEASRITAEIESLGVLDPETVAEVLREFFDIRRLHGIVREGGIDRAVRLVERSFEPEKARRIVHFLRSERRCIPFSFLEGVEAETLHSCIADEHAQTVALILAHLPPAKAAGVLDRLAPPARREVVERIAALEGASAEALECLEETLRKQIEAARFQSIEEEAGVRAVARILRASGGSGAALLEDLREGRPDLAEEVGKHLFVFEDIARLDDRTLQNVLQKVEPRRLALAVRNAAADVRAKVVGNISRRAAEALEEEEACLDPVRFADVEGARRAIVDALLGIGDRECVTGAAAGAQEQRTGYRRSTA